MTDHTKYRSSFNPWILGFPSLPDQPEKGSRPGREPSHRSWLLGIRCRLHQRAIDRELAAGTDPESSACRHRRAAQLTGMSERDKLASAYERLLAQSESPPVLDVAPVNWRGVRAAAPRLVRLAQRMREDPRIRAQGVACASLLLTDGDSPLYGPQDELRLVDAVRSTLALL